MPSTSSTRRSLVVYFGTDWTMSAAAADVIDLISDDEDTRMSPIKEERESTSFKRIKTEVNQGGHVVFCLDDESDSEKENAPWAPNASAAACMDTRLTTITGTDGEIEPVGNKEDDDVEEVAAPAAAMWKSNDDEEKKEEDDVAIVGMTGHFALVDFPHSRENCVTHPMRDDPLLRCGNCFCYVCDVLATDCKSWEQHCHATHGNLQWRMLREQCRRNNGIAPAAAVPPAAVSAFVPPVAVRAFVRRAPRVTTTSPSQFSVRSLLQAITTVHPVEVSPPPDVFKTNLRHYQRQSLAFMLEKERDGAAQNTNKSRGGWLADEVGMGKSAVVLALVATNPMQEDQCPTLQQIRAQMSRNPPLPDGNNAKLKGESNEGLEPLKVKTTVILTSVSLMGQWEDECKKHAPGLRIARYHGDQRHRFSPVQLHHLDLIISTATFKWADDIVDKFEFHRLVMDESHLFTTAPTSAKFDFAKRINSEMKWCVTATPFTTSINGISGQLHFLSKGRCLRSRTTTTTRMLLRQ